MSNFTLNGITTNNPGQGGGGNVTYIGTSEMIAQANLPVHRNPARVQG